MLPSHQCMPYLILINSNQSSIYSHSPLIYLFSFLIFLSSSSLFLRLSSSVSSGANYNSFHFPSIHSFILLTLSLFTIPPPLCSLSLCSSSNFFTRYCNQLLNHPFPFSLPEQSTDSISKYSLRRKSTVTE